jgi:hypothetical protein
MRSNFTLPELEEKLDGLAEGMLLQISARDYRPVWHERRGRCPPAELRKKLGDQVEGPL